jgi:hypothetical protein
MMKVQGHDHLYRDPNTGAIINTQTPPSKVLSSAINDINTLKKELYEIKQLLKEIVRNGNS